MEVDVEVMSNDECNSRYDDPDDFLKDHYNNYYSDMETITQNMLCASDFENDQDSCQGDVSSHTTCPGIFGRSSL